MKFDELLVHLGEFGRYQKLQYFLVCIPKIWIALHMLISVFIAAVPNHRCSIPGWENDKYSIQNESHQLYINASIPMVLDSKGHLSYSRCERYVPLGDEPLVNPDGTFSNSTKEECTQWVYDKSVFQSTIVSQLDLVCGKKSYRSHAQMIFMAGVLVGSLMFGILSDILGRKTCFCLAITVHTISGTAAAFAPEFYSFSVLRFIIGAASAGVVLISFVYATELIGPSKRRWALIPIMFFFTIGYVLLTLPAYFIRDWKYLEIACSVPGVIFLIYWLVLPESPRWLIATGKKERAKVVLRKMAEVNRVELTDEMLKDVSVENEKATESFTRVFTSSVLVVRVAVTCFNWMVVSMTYYGLSLNSGNLVGDIHLNFLMSGLVEFPALFLLFWVVNHVGRTRVHAFVMIVGGVACVSSLFTVMFADESHQWITITLAMIGKSCVSVAFCTIYILTSEIFPTVIRNGAMGAGSMCARVGGMLAPYIADLGDFVEGEMGQAVPLVTFGVSAVMAGALSLLLPETFNRKLPETIEDGIHFGRKDTKKDNYTGNELYTLNVQPTSHLLSCTET